MSSFWNRQRLPPVLRVHPELAGMIADEMDILSLSRWRGTCRANHQHASLSLRRTLTNRLQAFVPHPHQLIDIVEQHGGIFGGELALSFLLRHEPYRPSTLDVYTSHDHFEPLYHALLSDPHHRTRIAKCTLHTSTPLYAQTRHLAASLEVRLAHSDGRAIYIYVHQSRTCSPSAPIARAPCTALSNFVTSYGFGCGHPQLTLARRALVDDRTMIPESELQCDRDARVLDRLLAHGFELAVSPSAAWPEHRLPVPPDADADEEMKDAEGDGDTKDIDVDDDTERNPYTETTQTPEDCLRFEDLCSNQGRFSGDGGSFMGYFDPLGGDKERSMKANIAPYGSMVVGRDPSTFECDDGYEDRHENLDKNVVLAPVLFLKDPFSELRSLTCDRLIARARRRGLSF